MMADLGGHLPPPGSAVWSRDVRSSSSEERNVGTGGAARSCEMSYTMIVRHVVIGDAEIWEEPTPYVVYRVNVHTQHDHWYLYRRYSQFHSLHKKIMKRYGVNRELLPPKKISGNLSKQLIDKRRQLLERYLQRLIHNVVEIARSPELQVFLDVPTHDVVKVTGILTRHLHLHGDHLLENATPIALSINEMYAITLRLQLPSDTSGTGDVAGDLAHLYGFVHQLQRLRVTPPPPPCSVTCMTFDLSLFKSLHTLKLDHVQLSQVSGLLQVQRHLQRLTIQWSLHSLEELLVAGVEEKRRGSTIPGGGASGIEGSIRSPSFTSSDDSWRRAATERLTSSRVVIHSWVQLHTLVLSHNLITHLDNTLELLPVLRELNLSHNRLQVLSVPYLCLPSLEKLNVSHNQIHAIDDKGKVLERITHLNLSHNRLYTMDGIKAFVGVHVLNLAYNRLVSSADISKIVRLRRLATLGLEGNPISSNSACRIVVLAKFIHKSRSVELDGLPASSKEQARIKAYTSKYGAEPELWPVARPLVNLEKEVSVSYQAHKDHAQKPHLSASEPGFEQRRRPGSTTPPSPHMNLSLHAQQGQYNPHQYRPPQQRSPPSNLAERNRGRGLSGTPPLVPHSLPSAAAVSSRSSIDRLSFSSSEQSSQLGPSNYRRPSSAKTHRRSGLPDEATYTRPHPSASFSGSGTYDTYSALPDEERYSVGVTHHLGARGKHGRGLLPRSDPDGQSDVSSTSPDLMLRNASSSRGSLVNPNRQSVASGHSLSPPPPSPSLDPGQQYLEGPPAHIGNAHVKTVTPSMIQSALDALEGILDKATPLSLTTRHPSVSSTSRQSPVLPGNVTSALTAWISSQSLHQPGASATVSGESSRASVNRTPLLTPPPTPGQLQTSDKDSMGGGEGSQGVGRQGISAQDLIDALSTLIVTGDDRLPSSRHSSQGCSVPACTPREGLSEWAKMGIHPEEVIHALSALTIHQEDEEEEDHHRSYRQTSPAASPEPPSNEGDSSHQEDGFICLFPESTSVGTGYEEDRNREEVSLTSSLYEEGEEHISYRNTSVSPPEPELEVLDPFLNPDHGNSEPGQLLSTEPVNSEPGQLLSTEPVNSEPGQLSSTEPVNSQPGQLSNTEPVNSEPGQLSSTEPVNSEPGQLSSIGSVSCEVSQQELCPDVLRTSLRGEESGELQVKEANTVMVEVASCSISQRDGQSGGGASIKDNETPPTKAPAHQEGVEVGEEVGVVSSSPIESCLYADS